MMMRGSLSMALLLGLASSLGACATDGDGTDPQSGSQGGGGGKSDNPTEECTARGLHQLSTAQDWFHSVAIAGDRVFAVRTSQLPTTAAETSIVECPLEGCGSAPEELAKPGYLGREAQLAATATNVYWTERDLDDPLRMEAVMRQSLEGGDATRLFGVFGLGTQFNLLSPFVASADRLVFAAWQDSNGPTLRTVGDAETTTTAFGTVGRVQHPELATGGNRVAMWDSIYGSSEDLRKVRIYDTAGTLVTMTPRIEDLDQLAIDGDVLLYSARDASGQSQLLYACNTADCTQPVNMTEAYQAYGYDFTLANGRAYFVGQLDNGCDANVNGWGFMSCDTASLLDGTCTPQVHATGGFELLNIRSLAIGEHAAVYTDGLAGRMFRIDLAP